MKNKKFILGSTIFIMGFIGILTLLTIQIPMDKMPKKMLDKFSSETIKLLTLINPTIILIISVVIGTILFDKVHLTVPTLSGIIQKNITTPQILKQLKSGIKAGAIGGIIIVMITIIFMSYLPDEFKEVGENYKLSKAARFLYGGFTEEIIMRFGIMTLFVWIAAKVFGGLANGAYIIGIVIAAMLFAVAHVPLAFLALSHTPSSALIIYILIANFIAGTIFGWLYWKHGLEAAFVAHMFLHVIILITQQFITLNI
ncbi:MAG TPA: CPBP family intramembrane glutamic endopeptidase [Chitinophagaceae bacterium]|jgi:hypothetical protein|nr:CPBP family intramembrane glutamic endopeptidase [Chitinophagaceae bacterium]